MHKDDHREAPAVVSAFLLRYMDDSAEGRVQPLEAYQALFPGYEDVVAREYRKLIEKEVAGGEPRLASLEDALSTSSIVHEVRSIGGDPRQIGAYRVLDAVGKGGMGVVYLAEQAEPNRRRVALKVIKLGMDTREVLARFESERQALALMNHPHIAQVHDAGTTDQGRPFFVMEYVPGIPLNTFCDQHDLDLRERLEIFLQLCDAVQHAHQKGIIHRDLKPSNVLVAYQDGKPFAKIIDFGVAKSTNHRLTEMTVFTEQGQIIGTPEYMSPEQAEMSALDVDTRTDIYSLGVILYEILTGVLPFDSGELRRAGYVEIQRRIREEDPPSPSTRVSRLGAEGATVAHRRRTDLRGLVRRLRRDLDWITMKAMEKDRARRYASASELAADVVRHLSHEPVLAGRPSLTYRLRKLARKHRVGLGASAAAILLLVVGLIANRYLAANRFYSEALAHRAKHQQLQRELSSLEEKGRRAIGRLQSWRPVWNLAEEIGTLEQLEKTRWEHEASHDRAVLSFYQALDSALPGSSLIRRIGENLDELYFERSVEILRGEVTPQTEVFQGRVESLGRGELRARFEGRDLEISSDPPGAEVYCFRYEMSEAHLVPLPFDPRLGPEDPGRGVVGEPFLVVESVSGAREGPPPPFQPGDRLLEIRGHRVSRLTELARCLSSVGLDQYVEVRVLRAGQSLDVTWVPFARSGIEDVWVPGEDGEPRPLEAGRLLSTWEQLGFCLAGYPIDLVDGCRLGATRQGEPLGVHLPRGSYLLVLRKAGCVETRVPFAVPGEEPPGGPAQRRVRLLREGDVPPGFIYVPEGPVSYGGDRGVDEEGLVGGSQAIPGFLMARLEVTVAEYLEFLNDPQIVSAVDKVTGLWRTKSQEDVPIVPHKNEERALLCIWDSGKWVFKDSNLTGAKPVVGVCVAAAREYARWKTEKCGGRWRFRLPTDLEWEKAARGVDRRAYVWGNEPLLSACRSWHSSYRFWLDEESGTRKLRRRPEVVGSCPLDESVYAVRDMAGSVAEPVEGKSSLGFPVLRGGSWGQTDAQYYRIANREGRKSGVGSDAGLRLVADVPAP